MKSKLFWLEVVLLLAPFAALALLWSTLPARVPVHWNLQNEIDRWEPKGSGLLFPPLLAVGTLLLLHVLPRLDPKLRKRMGEESRMPEVLAILRVAIAAFFLVVFSIQIFAALGYSFSGRLLFNACLVLFAVLGNYTTALRPNYFVGIRTPWTLENADTWRATHRLGGRLMFFGSIALFFLQFVIGETACLIVFLVAVSALVIWAFWYSWRHFHALPATAP
ncbi:MAG: SdpI family protein [Chthoniobacterales bacterium]